MPRPFAGFRRYGPRVLLELSRDGESLGEVVLAYAERRVLGRLLARGVLVGALPTGAMCEAEEVYRAVLDAVAFTSPAPQIISLRVVESRAVDVDVLWRLALALEARCVVGEENGTIRVDLLLDGLRTRLAIALPEAPRLGSRDLAGAVKRLARRRRRERLLIFARDVSADRPVARATVAVQFGAASEEEVRRWPRRFGLRLSTSVSAAPTSDCFVGRIEDQVVYRMVCTPSAPALGLLPRDLLDRLAAPVSLVTDCRTEPPFRGLSIYPAALHWLAGWAREEGVGTLVLLVRGDNTASVRGAAKGGFELLGEVPPQAR